MNVPCKGCADRQVGCHGSCEKYQHYHKSRAESLEKRFEYMESTNYWSKKTERLMRRRMKEANTR